MYVAMFVKNTANPSPNKLAPWSVSLGHGTHLAADTELDGRHPAVRVDRLRTPASSRLALAIGRESNKVLVDYGILKAVPSVNRSLT